MFFECLWKDFFRLPGVDAIALGGSRAGTVYDESSDYDLYIYCTDLPGEDVRRRLLEKTCQYAEIGNDFWEPEDDCTLKDGVDIDILYRNTEDFSRELCAVVERYEAHNGYTTCLWHNLLHSRILADKSGTLTRLQDRYRVPYPQALQNNIIRRNFRLLTGNLPSYDRQLQKAALRGDAVSLNHRAAAFLESYFDILFALNRLTHPGEKRMLAYAKEHAEILPDGFEENVNGFLHNLFVDPEEALRMCRTMTAELEKTIRESGISL